MSCVKTFLVDLLESQYLFGILQNVKNSENVAQSRRSEKRSRYRVPIFLRRAFKSLLSVNTIMLR